MTRDDYFRVEQKNGIATIWFDQKDKALNVVSPDLIGFFDEVNQELQDNSEVKAIILISAKKDFIAGADIEFFQKVTKPGDFEPITRKGHEILNKIAESSKPIVAAIHGNCLGAGLEIALACHYRLASNARTTKLALPEVQLGLLPGGGGTQRLPKLVGIQKALDMMLTGKNIFAYPALKIGLVDRLVHKNTLYRAAQEIALQLYQKKLSPKKVRKSLFNRFLDNTAFGQKLVLKKAKQKVLKSTKGNYPAPLDILACVKAGLMSDLRTGLNEEAIRFEKLILSPESRQLVNIFFGMTAKKKNPLKESAKKIDNMSIIGAGFMGAGIAEISTLKNINVTLKDISPKTLSSAKKSIWKSLSKKIRYKALTKIEGEQYINSIKTQLDYEGLESSDIIIEAVFEDLHLKQKIQSDCEKHSDNQCIFASNTSALPIKAIASMAKHPELVIGMHYFSPVPKMPLLEIVKTEQTAEWVIASCLELGIRQGKTCIVVKDGPGFYTTRILAPMLNEALLLLEEGGDIQQIDQVMQKFGFPVGPITLIDEVGIDVGAHIMSGELTQFFKQQRGDMKISQALPKMAKKGYQGRKNKKGFYQYDTKTGKKIKNLVDNGVYSFFGGDSRKQMSEQSIIDRCSLVFINEAVRCLEESIISSPLDGDIGAIFGLGFPPFLGGPFRYLDTVGAQTIHDKLINYQQQLGLRFTPSQLLQAHFEKSFY